MSKLDPSLLIPTQKWTAVQWVDEYDNLKKFFGDPKRAKTLWLSAWSKRGTSDANTSDLRHSMKERGIEIPAGSIGGSLLDTGNSALDTIGSITKIGGTMAIVFNVIILIIVIMVILKVVKLLNPEAVGTVLKYAK
jgi:hypothetical protein